MWIDETQLRIGAEIGSGGEGIVYALTDMPDLVFKKYKGPVSGEIEAKLAWMVNHPPEQAALQRLTWPTRLVRGRNGQLAGFTMRKLSTATVSIGDVFHNDIIEFKQKLQRAPFDLAERHKIAWNLISVVAGCHRQGYVVVDLNQKNVLVTAQGHVILVDNDSFQATGQDGSIHRHNGKVMPGYESPHLKRARIQIPASHDIFLVAVLVFRLLMNSHHPFQGSTDLADDEGPPDTEKVLSMNLYPYDLLRRDSRVRPHPEAPPLAQLNVKIVDAFQKCFTEGLTFPDRRPGLAEWHTLLGAASRALKKCKRGHWYSPDRPCCLFEGKGKSGRQHCGATVSSLNKPIPVGMVDVLTGVRRTTPSQRTRTIPPKRTAPAKTPPQKTGGSPPPYASGPGNTTARTIVPPIPRQPWYYTGNPTVDGATKQTESILTGWSRSLDQMWQTSRRAAAGKPGKLLAIAMIGLLAFQTGVLGNVLNFAGGFTDDTPERVTLGGNDPEQAAANEPQVPPAQEENTGGPADTVPGQPTIAPIDQQMSSAWLVVANTGGSNLYINREPNLRFPIEKYPEGTRLEILDPTTVSADGFQWQRVRAPDGTEGWVATYYTAPADAS